MSAGLNPTAKKHTTLYQEGAVIQFAGANGAVAGADYAQACLDGIANALVRIDGHEAAFSFVSAMSDRLAAGIRQPTDWRDQLRKPLDPEPTPEPPAPEPSPTPPAEPPISLAELRRLTRRSVLLASWFLLGCGWAFAIGFSIGRTW